MVGKKCKNCVAINHKPMGYYTGNEPSPKGRGICARCEEEHIITEGKDGNLWKVVNGKWVKEI